jgi:hypothetical protein
MARFSWPCWAEARVGESASSAVADYGSERTRLAHPIAEATPQTTSAGRKRSGFFLLELSFTSALRGLFHDVAAAQLPRTPGPCSANSFFAFAAPLAGACVPKSQPDSNLHITIGIGRP